ncbi:MAG: TVP38/TMEM64 family protein [Thermoanaerobacterium sp.]|nr:TVP38/TMEM64 family protein [Thermoanaerobacterium sp.]
MRRNKNKLFINGLLIAAFAFLFFWVLFRYGDYLTYLLKDPAKFEKWILGFGAKGVLVFILIQVLQVVIFIIPGEVVQIAGGYLYGAVLGSLYSLIGITIGSVLCFAIARLLGYEFVRGMLSEDKLKKFDYIINNKKGELGLFIVFLMPGLPKDALSYVAGLTPVRFINYFLITALARLPGIIISSYIGSNIEHKNYMVSAVASVIAVILFVIGFLNKDRIIKKIN